MQTSNLGHFAEPADMQRFLIRSSSSPSLIQGGQNFDLRQLIQFYIHAVAIMPRISVSLQCLTWRFTVALLIAFSSATVFLLPCALGDGSSSSSATVQIVYTEKPVGNEEAAHLHTLANVLGSEKAARQSLLYVYKTAATGFSAKLTPEQVDQLKKQPGVLQVVPSQTMQLQSGSGQSLR